MNIKSSKSRIAALCLATAALVVVGTAQADTCKNVDIVVVNQGSQTVEVLSMDFRAHTDNQDRHEGLPNTQVAAGATKTVGANQNLAGIEGYDMKSITIHYKAWCAGANKWSAEKTWTDTKFLAPKCGSGSKYTVQIPKRDECN